MVVRIAVLNDFVGNAHMSADWSQLPEEAQVDFIREHLSEEEAVVRLQPYEVLASQRERNAYPGSLLRRLPNLKMILGNGRLNPSLDLGTAHELGIRVVNSGFVPRPADAPPAPRVEGPRPGAGGSTGELTWFLMMGLMRHIPGEIESFRSGGWQVMSGPGLSGKTIGIVGLGNIGAGVARVAQVFGMKVIAWSQNLTEERARAEGATLVAKDDLFRQSDVVTMQLILSERTRHIVGAHELSLMKPTAYLINTSRAGLVDEEALLAALRERRIAGAAVDVYQEEPLAPDHPFRSMDNVVATPHIGYGTDEGYAAFFRGVVRTISAYMAGEPLEEFTAD